ncbi:MAG: hypothetical protein ACLRHW_12865 [Coprobacillus cateniformis]
MTSSWLNIVVIFQVICTYLPEINGMNSSDPIYGDFVTTAENTYCLNQFIKTDFFSLDP